MRVKFLQGLETVFILARLYNFEPRAHVPSQEKHDFDSGMGLEEM
jgi:hypothetical protein